MSVARRSDVNIFYLGRRRRYFPSKGSDHSIKSL